ncbi:MAG: hypothetical protein IJ689_05660 [Alphaproteobacteria bacterium]|nr:hypothetical protein [Alphaproteobacteria bacterium]
MKNVITFIMVTLLLVAGYYIGSAVANNSPDNTSANTPEVMVIEEEYGTVSIPDSQNAPMKAHQKADTSNHNTSSSQTTSSSNTATAVEMEESLSETSN